MLNITEVIPIGEHYGGEYNLACPACGYDYVHPTRVRVNPAGADGVECEITHEGVATQRGEPEGRGVLIAVRLDGECGHRWELRLHFHKGITFLEVRTLPAPSADSPIENIWRD